MPATSYARTDLIERYGYPEPDHVCAYCECVEVAHRGDYCSPACEFQDATRDEDNANDYGDEEDCHVR